MRGDQIMAVEVVQWWAGLKLILVVLPWRDERGKRNNGDRRRREDRERLNLRGLRGLDKLDKLENAFREGTGKTVGVRIGQAGSGALVAEVWVGDAPADWLRICPRSIGKLPAETELPTCYGIHGRRETLLVSRRSGRPESDGERYGGPSASRRRWQGGMCDGDGWRVERGGSRCWRRIRSVLRIVALTLRINSAASRCHHAACQSGNTGQALCRGAADCRVERADPRSWPSPIAAALIAVRPLPSAGAPTARFLAYPGSSTSLHTISSLFLDLLCLRPRHLRPDCTSCLGPPPALLN